MHVGKYKQKWFFSPAMSCFRAVYIFPFPKAKFRCMRKTVIALAKDLLYQPKITGKYSLQ